MKVNSNRDISFKSIYTNRSLKRGLEFAADNGALLAATTTLGFSAVVRPMAILLTPHADKENKKVACAKSLASSSVGYLLTYLASMPVARAISKIDRQPERYIKPDTIKNFSRGCEKLVQSKSYNLATQMFKLGLGILIAVPKAILTSNTTPYFLKYLFKKPLADEKNDFAPKTNTQMNFKGKADEKLTKGIGKIIDTKWMQTFSNKNKDSNFPMHIIALTDALTTGTFIHQIDKNQKIEQNRKKALIYNAGISTTLSIVSGYLLDRLLKNPTEKFIQKFKEVNKGEANLDKQVNGIKIAKPILILGCVYYIFIPFISTFLADVAERNPKLDLHYNKKNN